MSAFPFHMAMAALAGASVAAFSSYYLHCRALSQLLEFALVVERRRGNQSNSKKEKQRRGISINARRRRKAGGRRGSMAEEENVLVDEKNGDLLRKERGFSRIECLPGDTYEPPHVLSDFSPY